MFIQNKYYFWYLSLMLSRQDLGLNKKSVEYYTEKHHIIPKCMGGDNESENLVLLSGREHYLAHWLLCKCVSAQYKFKMACAFFRMSHQCNTLQQRKFSSAQYEHARKIHSEEKSKLYTKNPKYTSYGKKNIHSKDGIEVLRENGRRTAALLKNDPVMKAKQIASMKKTWETKEQNPICLKNLNRKGFTPETRKAGYESRKRSFGAKVIFDNRVCFYTYVDALWYCNNELGESISSPESISKRCKNKKNKNWEFV